MDIEPQSVDDGNESRPIFRHPFGNSELVISVFCTSESYAKHEKLVKKYGGICYPTLNITGNRHHGKKTDVILVDKEEVFIDGGKLKRLDEFDGKIFSIGWMHHVISEGGIVVGKSVEEYAMTKDEVKVLLDDVEVNRWHRDPTPPPSPPSKKATPTRHSKGGRKKRKRGASPSSSKDDLKSEVLVDDESGGDEADFDDDQVIPVEFEATAMRLWVQTPTTGAAITPVRIEFPITFKQLTQSLARTFYAKKPKQLDELKLRSVDALWTGKA